MFKRLLAWILVAVCCFSGCSKQTDIPVTEPVEITVTTETTIPVADGYDVLGGNWIVGGIYYEGQLIDIRQYDALQDLYDTVYLFFSEDGSFLFINMFFREGTYENYGRDSAGHDIYLLKTDSVYRYDYEDGEMIKKESTSDTKRSYWVTLTDDPNAINVCPVDPETNKADPEGEVLYFVKDSSSDHNSTQAQTSPSQSDDTRIQEDTSLQKKPTQDTSSITTGQRNALDSAKSYLRYMAFSYEGLIDQLEYEGYTYAEAKYAVDNCGADWYEQAVACAESYLEYMSFSRSDLIDQLEYEGFTHEQAVYGVNQAY